MRRMIYLFLTGILLISFSSCRADHNYQIANGTQMFLHCSKDSVDELISITGEFDMGGLSSGLWFDEEHCYNVTPSSVAEITDIKLFKLSNSCFSVALIDGKVYEVCNSFGGNGLVNAIPWDYDEDGNMDLLIAASWGSGLHRSEITVFNTVTKESIMIYDTSDTKKPRVDLTVAAVSPPASSEMSHELPVYYHIYSVDITYNTSDASLAYTTTGFVGSVVVEDGVPVFKPA